MVRTLFFDPRFDTARCRVSFAACNRPEGEFGAGGEDGGEGMGDGRGDGVKGRSAEQLKEAKENGARVIPFRTIGMGALILLGFMGLQHLMRCEVKQGTLW